MPKKNQIQTNILKIINALFLAASVAVCSILMLLDLPGVELLETNPNWLLIWVVAWSIKRTIWQGAIAGLAIGWIYDGIVVSSPSHVLSFVVVGIFTSALQKQKYLGEDFISVAFVVFFMTVLTETIFAWQYTIQYSLTIPEAIEKYQQITIISAIITSLWSPAFYYPFNLWDEKIRLRISKVRS
ncbi:rod shape-determining protein MreD [Pleurocapsales cyanobacterium LEGE 10410]|nr:rod shape-determining protein MreD [Pleurocapsales cyanobacterium LEGE 10410]